MSELHRYRILQEDRKDTLQAKVEKHLEWGWELHGPLQLVHGTTVVRAWIQVMVHDDYPSEHVSNDLAKHDIEADDDYDDED